MSLGYVGTSPKEQPHLPHTVRVADCDGGHVLIWTNDMCLVTYVLHVTKNVCSVETLFLDESSHMCQSNRRPRSTCTLYAPVQMLLKLFLNLDAIIICVLASSEPMNSRLPSNNKNSRNISNFPFSRIWRCKKKPIFQRKMLVAAPGGIYSGRC